MIFNKVREILSLIREIHTICTHNKLLLKDIEETANDNYEKNLDNTNRLNEIEKLLFISNENYKNISSQSQNNNENEEQKEIWKKILNSGVLFMINNTLSPYNISLGIKTDGTPVVYNKPKIYTKDEYDQIIKKISNNNSIINKYEE